tara:strand:- start:30 stop:353 length:324 start_codon:yes stop_codon:yes gene_type:complete
MIYKPNYNAEKHAEKYIILDWVGNIKTFSKKNIIAFDTIQDADDYLDNQVYKMSKLKDEKEIIKNDYNNNFDAWFYDTKNEYQIKQCKEIFTNYICDPFGFSQAINI